MLGHGLGIDEMAERCGVNPATVMGHIERMADKDTELVLEHLQPEGSRMVEIRKGFDACGGSALKPVREYPGRGVRLRRATDGADFPAAGGAVARVTIPDFEGRDVRLPEERWRHISGRSHRYMGGTRAEVEEILAEPDMVRKSRSVPEHGRLYSRWFGATAAGAKQATAVARILSDGDAFVQTAYASGQPKAGEEIWPAVER